MSAPFAAFAIVALTIAAPAPAGAQAPAVESIVRDDATPTNAASVDFVVTFSEEVTGVDTTDFQVAIDSGGLSGAAPTSVLGALDTYTVTVDTGSGDGVLGLDLIDDDSIVGVTSGEPLGGTGAGNGDFTSSERYTIDKTQPAVDLIELRDDNPTNSDEVTFRVEFSEAIDPATFTADDIEVLLDFAGAAGSTVTQVDSTHFDVRVTPDDPNAEGDLAIRVAATVQDPAGNDLAETADSAAYTIDNTPPTIDAIVLLDPTTTNLDTLRFEVQFSEPIAPESITDAAAELQIAGTNPSGKTISADLTNNPDVVFSVSLNDPDADGTVGITVLAGTVADQAGNALAADSAPSALYTVDNSPPTIEAIRLLDTTPTSADSVRFEVEFAGPISDASFTTADISISSDFTGIASASISTRTNPIYRVTVNIADTEADGLLNITVGPTISDAAGNTMVEAVTSSNYRIDNTPPGVTITLLDPNPTNLDQVRFGVQFNESVGSSFSAADITRVGTALSGGSSHFVTGSNPNFVVTVTPANPQREGEAGIVIGTDIFDLAGNQFSGEESLRYTIDNTPPQLVGITRLDPSPTNLDTVRFEVEFDEEMDEGTFTADDITGTGDLGGLASAIINADTNPVFLVSLSLADPDADGTLGMELGVNLRDLAGNLLQNGGVSQQYIIDNTPPTALISFLNQTVTNSDTLSFFIHFSESVGNSFSQVDVTPTGSLAEGANVNVNRLNDVDYVVEVTPADPTADGTLGIDIGTSIFDIAGNAFEGAQSPGRYFVDNTPLTVEITLPDPNPTKADSVAFDILWSDDVIGFDENDLTITGSLRTGATLVLTGSGTEFTVEVTPANANADGRIGLEIGNGVSDPDGNPFNGGASPVDYVFDHTAPVTAATSPTGELTQAGPTFPVAYSASDAGGSGVDFVELWFRRGTTGTFRQFGGEFSSSPITFDSRAGGGNGTYEFYTIGVDNLENREAPPPTPDIRVIFTNTEPNEFHGFFTR